MVELEEGLLVLRLYLSREQYSLFDFTFYIFTILIKNQYFIYLYHFIISLIIIQVHTVIGLVASAGLLYHHDYLLLSKLG